MRKLILPVILLLFPIFTHSQTYWNLEPVWIKTEPDSAKCFGMYVETADVNGDGSDDICMSYGTFIEFEWMFHDIYFGGLSMDTIPDLSWMTTMEDSAYSIKACGDFNNDGFGDLIFGAQHTHRALILLGSSTMDTIPDLILSENAGNFGRNIASGDVNNDGYDDVIMGAYGSDKAYIYFGDSIMDNIADVILSGEEITSHFGQTVGSGYDLNNDGFDDIAVGAPGFSALGFWQGRIYIYYGGENMDTIPDLWIDGRQPSDFWGDVITLAKDFCSANSDTAYADLWIGGLAGAPRDTAFYYCGGNPMDSTLDEIIVGSDSLFIGYGYSIAGVDNINNDQWGEMLVGACYYPYNLGESRGKVYLYLGGDSFDTIPDAYAVGADSQAIGWVVGSCDVNGDGINELFFTNYAAAAPVPISHRIWICKYTGLGVEEEKEKDLIPKITKLSISCHPNPFTTSTIVILSSIGHRAKSMDLQIFNASGRLVKSVELKTSTYQLGADLKTGIYFLKLNDKSVGKVVKVR